MTQMPVFTLATMALVVMMKQLVFHGVGRISIWDTCTLLTWRRQKQVMYVCLLIS